MDIVSNGPVLHLAGDFDVRSTWEVRIALYDLLDRHHEVVVDMAEVTSVDMTALRVLAAATRWAGVQQRRVTLRDCSPVVRRMLHLTRLAHVVDVTRVSA